MSGSERTPRCIASCLAVLVWAGLAVSGRADNRLTDPRFEDRVGRPHAGHLDSITPNWREWPKEQRPDMTFSASSRAEAQLTPEKSEHASAPRYPVHRDGSETRGDPAPRHTASVILPAGIEIRFKVDPSSRQCTRQEPQVDLPGLPLTAETPLTWTPPVEDKPTRAAPAPQIATVTRPARQSRSAGLPRAAPSSQLPRIIARRTALGPRASKAAAGSPRPHGPTPDARVERVAMPAVPPLKKEEKDLTVAPLKPLAALHTPPQAKGNPVVLRSATTPPRARSVPPREGLPELLPPSRRPFSLESRRGKDSQRVKVAGGPAGRGEVDPRGSQPLRIRLDEPASQDRSRMPTPASPPRTTELAARSRTPVVQVWNRELAPPKPQQSKVSQVDWMPDLDRSTPIGRPEREADDEAGCPAPVQRCSDPFKPRTGWEPGKRVESSPPAANASPGLKGYCPVELLDNGAWVRGDPRWTAVHRGRTYLLSGPRQKQRFLTNPDRYCPVLGGDDPVMLVDEGRRVEGDLDYAVICEDRLYLFSGPYPRARFRQNPRRYSCVEQGTAY